MIIKRKLIENDLKNKNKMFVSNIFLTKRKGLQENNKIELNRMKITMKLILLDTF